MIVTPEELERFRAAVERAVLEQLGDGDCGLRGWQDDEPCEGGLFVDSSGLVCDKNGDPPELRVHPTWASTPRQFVSKFRVVVASDAAAAHLGL